MSRDWVCLKDTGKMFQEMEGEEISSNLMDWGGGGVNEF